jgi:hypothetical protein
MEQHRIKSAREIALEKIANLPDLTPEELLKQKENEFKPVGEAIARRYLKGAVRTSELPLELKKYRDTEGLIVKRFLVTSLVRSIEFADTNRSQRAIDGLEVLTSPNSHFQDLRKDFDKILSRFEEEIRQRQGIYEIQAREILQKYGVSGSAVKPNLKFNQEWQEEQGRIQSAYDEKADKLRSNLLQLSGITP